MLLVSTHIENLYSPTMQWRSQDLVSGGAQPLSLFFHSLPSTLPSVLSPPSHLPFILPAVASPLPSPINASGGLGVL